MDTQRHHLLSRRIEFADFEFYPEARRLYKSGARIKVGPQVTKLMTFLIEHAHHPVDKERIDAHLWNGNRHGSNNLNVVISNTRLVLGDRDEEDRRFIATVGADSYRWICPILSVRNPEGSYKNVQAEHEYREGLRTLEKRSDSSIRASISHFNKAIDFDASHALAWVGLADAHIVAGIHCLNDPREAYPKARSAAEKAAAIPPSIPDALVSSGVVKLCYDRDWRACEALLLEALKSGPNSHYVYKGLALLQMATGRAAEGVASLRASLRNNPLPPAVAAILCHMLNFSRNYEDAIDAGRRAVDGDESSCLAHCCLGSALLSLKINDEALFHFGEAVRLSKQSQIFVALRGHACGLAGRRDEAEQALAQLTAVPRHAYVPSYLIALIHLGLGDLELAIEWLERACEERSHWVIFLHVDPLFDPLRQDLRFKELVGRIGFPGGYPG